MCQKPRQTGVGLFLTERILKESYSEGLASKDYSGKAFIFGKLADQSTIGKEKMCIEQTKTQCVPPFCEEKREMWFGLRVVDSSNVFKYYIIIGRIDYSLSYFNDFPG
jgi:hypothetical protein